MLLGSCLARSSTYSSSETLVTKRCATAVRDGLRRHLEAGPQLFGYATAAGGVIARRSS